ncbi:EAL domain-containing protein [Clostridiaceae bacterium 35-E11]
MKSIRTQMLVYLMAGAVFLFSALGCFVNLKLQELPDYIKEQYGEIVSAKADEVSKELNGFLEQIKIVSQSPVIKSMDLDSIKSYLPSLILQGKHRNMTIADAQGKGWSTLGVEMDISNQEQYQEIIVKQKDYLISQPFISPYADPNTPIIIISHAVKNNKKTVGLVNIVVEIEFLNKILGQMNLKKTGYGWIVDKEGHIIAHPDSNILLKTNMEEYMVNNHKVMEKILDKPSGMAEYIDEKGEKMLALFKRIEGAPDWIFIVSISAKEVYAEVEKIRNTILTAIIAGLGLVVIFAFVYSKSISRPILKLIEVFEKAANGQLQVKADEQVPNEIGIAAKSFNRMLAQIKHLTYKDTITGLYNYNGFSLELPYKLKAFEEKEGIAAIVIISIDDFKRINSISGYEVGNEVLYLLAKQLKKFINEEEGVARFFGDEFILLLWQENMHILKKRIHNLWKQYSGERKMKDHEFILKASIGVSIIDPYDYSIEEAIHQATIAKLTVKKAGGNNYRFYNLEIDKLMKEEQKIENDLYHAINNEELYLVYQPIVDVSTGKIMGTEALLRWHHKTYGNVSPLTLIQIAERNGLIIEIGKWVLKEACTQNKQWQDQGYAPIIVSVNVSALQFEQTDFVEMVQQVLQETGMHPSYLELEITETNAMTSVEEKLKKIKQLKEMGVCVAIDDFGTGYSSLAYFTRFPIDTLKIDRSFIQDMLNDENAKTIVATIIKMAQAIKIKTTAEGVETIEQLKHLQDRGCDKIQGYLISKPVESCLIEQMLKAGKE